MSRIVLITCASKKSAEKSRARELYQSTLFKLNLKYAESLKPEKIFILSAKHGLLNLDQEIEPYNQTLNKMPAFERKIWAEKVLNQLKKVSDLQNDEFIFLAGDRYRSHLIPRMAHYEIPLKGLGIGKQLKFLKDKVKK